MSLRPRITDVREIGHDVLSSTQSPKTGALVVNIGNAVYGTTKDEGCAVYNATCGVMCRPANPTKGQNSCQAVSLTESDGNIVIGLRDLRSVQSVGALSPGDSCLYESAAGKARIYVRADGSVSVLANNGSQTITIDTSGNVNVHTSGSITLDGGTASVAPNGTASISGGFASLAYGPQYLTLVAELQTAALASATAAAALGAALISLGGEITPAYDPGGFAAIAGAAANALALANVTLVNGISALPLPLVTTKTTAT